VGACLVCFVCVRQVDLKSIVAYSSVCHIGLVFVGLLFFSRHCLLGGYLIMIFHGLVSSCLFMLLFFIYVRFHSRRVVANKNVLQEFPLFRGWFFLFISLNMSVPPSLGFFSEIMVLGPLLVYFFFLGV
jgi:NADH-ubiquinone oxidoreductase chain 4